MKLEVGMYVRTKNNGIAKIKSFHSNIYDDYICISYCFDLVRKKEITKASHNIIDLIKVGDYVNGYKVIDSVKNFKVIIDKLELNTKTGLYHNTGITNESIKSIVTKEQFESMKYKIGD